MKKDSWKNIRYEIEVWLFFIFQFLIRFCPNKILIIHGNCIGWLCYTVFRIRRKVTLSNLKLAFPKLTGKERDLIALRSYQHAAHVLLEFVRFPFLSTEDIMGRSEVRNKLLFKDSIQKGKGAILLTAHFGNWEWYGALLNQLGYSLSYLVKKQHNLKSDKILNDIRREKGAEIIPLGLAVRGVLKALRNNRFVAIVGDQDAGHDGVFVDFFGRPASTAVGVASLALRTGASVFFGYTIRKPNGHYVCYGEEINLNQFQGTEKNKMHAFLQEYMNRLEVAICQYPEQYFWMHKRWRTRPPLVVSKNL